MPTNTYIHNSRTDRFKRWTLDTLAGVTYYQPIFWGIEISNGIPHGEGLENRIIMTLFNVTVGSGLAANYRDYCIRKTKAESNIGKMITTIFTQLTFYIPVYSALLLCKNTPLEKISEVLPAYSAGTALLAIFYGPYLEYFRKKIGKSLYDRENTWDKK